MKKMFLMITLVCMTLCLSGCSANSSAESVAKEMVKRLSEENYKGIGELFYQDENAYFDEDVFKSLLESKQLTIPGNDKIEIKEIGSEITNEDGYTTVEVKISIDNGRIYNISTIEVDEKWYVYEPDFYDNPLIIVVPTGSKVKLNDKKLSDDYKQKRAVDITVDHPNLRSYYDLYMSDVELDAYVVENLIEGKYDITVEGEKTVKDVVYTYSQEGSAGSTNYDHDYEIDEYIYYMFDTSKEVGEIEKSFVNDYLNNIYKNAVETHSIEGIKKYFDESSNLYASVEKDYTSLINNVGDSTSSSLPNSYNDNFVISDLKIHSVNEYNDLVAICLTYKLEYQVHKRYSSSFINSDTTKTSTMNTIMVLKKMEDGNYKITNGKYLFAK